jgi:hypothetical protein
MLDSRFGLFACEPPVSDSGHTNGRLPAYPTHFKRAYVAFSVQPGWFVKQRERSRRFSSLIGNSSTGRILIAAIEDLPHKSGRSKRSPYEG